MDRPRARPPWRPSYHMEILKELAAPPKTAAPVAKQHSDASKVDELMGMLGKKDKMKEDEEPATVEAVWETMPTPEQLLAYGMTTVRTTDNHGLIECSIMEHSSKPLRHPHPKYRHTVIMRDVAKSDEDALVLRLVQWCQRGFINYCGLDEVMTFGVDLAKKRAEIGKRILQGRWEEAGRLMGFNFPVVGDDWSSCVLSFHIEIRSRYITAYQNLLWNKFVSDRVSRYGGTIFHESDNDIYYGQLNNPFSIVVPMPHPFFPRMEAYVHGFYGDRMEEDGLTWDSLEKASSQFDVDHRWHRVMLQRPTNVQWEMQSMASGPDATLTVIIHFDLPVGVDASSAMREITSMAGGNREGKTCRGMSRPIQPKRKIEEIEEEDDDEKIRFEFTFGP